MIPFQDLNRLHASIEREIASAIEGVVASSSFVGGSAVAEFEANFAAAHKVPQAAGCGSGTDALVLALKATGIGAGDEVIVPSMTFVATAEAVVHAGAEPVIADVNATSLLLDQQSVEAVRTSRTRAVIPVHLFGHVVPAETITAWRSSGLVVIEDAAQAHLATVGGRPVGTFGDAACFSFYPGKNLGAFGDGGAVISNNADVVERVRVLRDHGRRSKYVHDEIGWCSRLDGLQAAVLAVKLRHLPTWTAARRALAQRYADRLAGSPISLVPWSDEGAVHHLLVVRVPAAARDAVQAELRAKGIATGVHYPVPLSRQPALAGWTRTTPHAELAADEVLSLPMDPLMDVAEVDVVCDALESVLDGLGAVARA